MVDDRDARNDFGLIEGNYICRHHVEPRVQLYVPKEETFPIPLRYIDGIRRTHTNLDVVQESRIDDYWNVDVDRHLFGVMDWIHEVHNIEWITSERIHVVWGTAYKNSSNHQT